MGPIRGLFKYQSIQSENYDDIIKQLRDLGAAAALIEDDYLDRDFSEAYSAYYAKTFKRHSKICTRVLLFSCSLSFLAGIVNPTASAERLQTESSSHYLGHIILRPISRAPVSQAILRAPPPPPGFESHLLVKARYTAHILGAELAVDAVPMTQQDSRIGACVQASIWVIARHIHARHRGPWLSTVAITAAAIANTEHSINRSLPAGSEFLTANNAVAALRAAGREPLIYAHQSKDAHGKLDWGALRPADIINRYVDSGIPVSIWVDIPGQSVGHAVVATGQVLKSTSGPSSLPAQPTRAEFSEAFFVNDDQIGPNVIVPVKAISGIGQTPYCVADNTSVLIIPLPSKVFLPAETAEALAWGILGMHASGWASHKAAHVGKLGSSEVLGDEFVDELSKNNVLARTYLTYGWKYKHRALRNQLEDSVKTVARDLDVPRYVYVTEFSLLRQLENLPQHQRRVIAHCVVDATAKHEDLESIRLFHAPGLCLWHGHDAKNSLVRYVIAVKDDVEYYPKARGEKDFQLFTEAASP
jgi:hypothetical protein